MNIDYSDVLVLILSLPGNNNEIGTSSSSHRQYDYVYCSELAQHLASSKSLPSECMKFKDLYSDLKRRDTDTTHPTQILS